MFGGGVMPPGFRYAASVAWAVASALEVALRNSSFLGERGMPTGCDRGDRSWWGVPGLDIVVRGQSKGSQTRAARS